MHKELGCFAKNFNVCMESRKMMREAKCSLNNSEHRQKRDQSHFFQLASKKVKYFGRLRVLYK
jgi:hypothetical protein